MRIAALYDIHGNLPALEAVLADVRRSGADRIVVGGDVLPGPMPRETLECLLGLDTPMAFIRGNGESAVLAHLAGHDLAELPEPAREAVGWVATQLDETHRRVIAGWPPTLRITSPELGELLFCHATPECDTEVFTRLTPEEALVPIFGELDVELVVCGHTHMPFDRRVAHTRVVNAGSVGMPFGAPRAAWLLVGPDLQLRQTDYDLESAAARIRSTRYPQADEFADSSVLHPRTEAEMLAVYSSVEPKEGSLRRQREGGSR